MRVVVAFAVAFGLLVAIAAMTACSPRAYREVNKLAPDPPYAEQRPSYMDGAQYLRDTEPLE